MKKIFLLLLFLIGTIANAQLLDGDPFVSSFNSSFGEPLSEKNIVERAEQVKALQLINNKAIQLQYVIPALDTLEISTIAAYTHVWLKSTSDKRFLITEVDYKDQVPTIEGKCYLGLMSKHKEGLTYRKLQVINENIHAWADFRVEIKDNRIRVTVSVPCYDVSYSVVGDDELPDVYKDNKQVPVSNRPPFKDSTYKKSWSEAFVETNLQCATLIAKYLDYVNNSYAKSKTAELEKVNRQNEDW